MTDTSDKRTTGSSDASHPPAAPSQPLADALDQLRAVLGQLDKQAYTAAGLAGMEGTIGGHVRHEIDHVRILLDGAKAGEIDYDQRERDTPVERDPAAAVAAIEQLSCRLHELDAPTLARPVTVRGVLSATGAPATMASSVAREMACVLSHTIHHHAMLTVMLRAVGVKLPRDFGYAPSTLAYRDQLSCAQ